jgi:hypothetical protein
VYLPTGPAAQVNTGQAEAPIELRRTPDGRTALIAFTALDRLIECCGEHQPWILVKTEHLPKIHAARPYDLIVLDSPLPDELKRRSTLV